MPDLSWIPEAVAGSHDGSRCPISARSTSRWRSPGRSPGDRSCGQALRADSEAAEYRGRWEGVQIGFVDEPRAAVQQADALVAEVMQDLAGGFAEERGRLEAQWTSGEEVGTEEVRRASESTGSTIAACTVGSAWFHQRSSRPPTTISHPQSPWLGVNNLSLHESRGGSHQLNPPRPSWRFCVPLERPVEILWNSWTDSPEYASIGLRPPSHKTGGTPRNPDRRRSK